MEKQMAYDFGRVFGAALVGLIPIIPAMMMLKRYCVKKLIPFDIRVVPYAIALSVLISVIEYFIPTFPAVKIEGLLLLIGFIAGFIL